MVFGTCFGLLEVFLDSQIEVFWILGRVLDSGKCFGFWDVFFDFGACFVPSNHRMFVIG